VSDETMALREENARLAEGLRRRAEALRLVETSLAVDRPKPQNCLAYRNGWLDAQRRIRAVLNTAQGCPQ
jgi:hypothetical protein